LKRDGNANGNGNGTKMKVANESEYKCRDITPKIYFKKKFLIFIVKLSKTIKNNTFLIFLINNNK